LNQPLKGVMILTTLWLAVQPSIGLSLITVGVVAGGTTEPSFVLKNRNVT
jgi:hypothetical protein